jgi:hypothetical protein
MFTHIKQLVYHMQVTARPYTVQVDGSKAMPPNSAIRGAYINSGSKDVGPDMPLSALQQQQRQQR